MTTIRRTDYPGDYRPGRHWAVDEAWEILDQVKEGAMSYDVRCFLAGLIAGTLIRRTKDFKDQTD